MDTLGGGSIFSEVETHSTLGLFSVQYLFFPCIELVESQYHISIMKFSEKEA
jgi:hypothetical protein